MAKTKKKEKTEPRDPFAYQLAFKTGKGKHKDKRKKGSKKQQKRNFIEAELDEWEGDENE